MAAAGIVVRSQVRRRSGALLVAAVPDRAERERWRMPPLATLAPSDLVGRKLTLMGMWVYLVIAMGVVVLRIVELAGTETRGRPGVMTTAPR